LELIQDTYQQLEMIASSIIEKIFQRFPTLIPEVMEIIVKCIAEQRDKSREVVESIIDSEQNYLFTNDTNYKEN
jgi:vacuolar protein sorting-associated protein 1